MIQKGTWVQIHHVVLGPSMRAPQVPDDTKRVPLELWTKGFLLSDSVIGEQVTIKTITGRIQEGTLVDVNPSFKHNYGHFVPEIITIGEIVKQIMTGDDPS